MSDVLIERIARAICKTWLKPDPKREPEYTNQRWPLFIEEAAAVVALSPQPERVSRPTSPNTDESKP